ncbi:hypothetical protein COP2_039399 [Malus domestica]
MSNPQKLEMKMPLVQSLVHKFETEMVKLVLDRLGSPSGPQERVGLWKWAMPRTRCMGMVQRYECVGSGSRGWSVRLRLAMCLGHALLGQLFGFTYAGLGLVVLWLRLQIGSPSGLLA